MEIKYNRTNAGHNAGKTFAIAIALFLINILKASALDGYQPRLYKISIFLSAKTFPALLESRNKNSISEE